MSTQDGWKAWAYPVSVDLLLVAAWRRLRYGTAKAAAGCWFVIALAASLGANVATAGLLDLGDVPAWLRILVAGWPAVAFLGGTLLAHSAPTTALDNDVHVVKGQEEAPESASEPSAQPAVEKAPERPAVAVPTALVDHARTGTSIDTPTLRARLGVPAPLAEAIAAQLRRRALSGGFTASATFAAFRQRPKRSVPRGSTW